MGINSGSIKLLRGRVMHGRLIPTRRAFNYGVYYLGFRLGSIPEKVGVVFRYNRPGWMAFYDSDHGARGNQDLKKWAMAICRDYGWRGGDFTIDLVAMPRVLGYVFNPVSFWMCRDNKNQLCAVIAEVNNTFGETHSYLCANSDWRSISENDIITAKKLFHVSPFLRREGYYQFRFFDNADKFGAWIDYFNADGEKQLVTALTGTWQNAVASNLWGAFFRYPLVALAALIRIHWQALKLWLSGIRYVAKPEPHKNQTSASNNLQNTSG